MPREERSDEAPIHFELYRLLKNNLSKQNSTSINYESLHPEFRINSKSLDLLINAKIDNNIRHFLAIEVKRPTMRSYLLFDSKSVQQIDYYSKNITSVYSALTDGYVFRLFGKNLEHNYKIELKDHSISRLLEELLELYIGKRNSLSFPLAPPLDKEELIKERDGLVKALNEVLDNLKNEKGFKITQRLNKMTRIRTLTFGSIKKILDVAVETKKSDVITDISYVHIQLSELRSVLGRETLYEFLVKLSKNL
ncbi:MAG: hypothetical protein ABIH76_07885, partial [Candidatus Bathyarchaeota archaeon]